MPDVKHYKNLTYKDKLAIVTSSISFIIGWALVCINFFLPPIGMVADSTLWILGQALLYCGGVIGIAQYTKGEIKKIRYQVGLHDNENGEDEY